MTSAQESRQPASTTVRAVPLSGPAGRLEALLNEETNQAALDPSLAAGGARFSALVCHPHPLGGGTMHNKVVYRAMKTLLGFHLPVLRFNFRGVGLSEGEHDGGQGEVEDVRAALDWLQREFGLPILFCGFSFGAYTGLRACCGEERVMGIAALGAPVRAAGRAYSYEFLKSCLQPKLFLSGGEDAFAPRQELATALAGAPPPAELVLIEGADHFFTGKLDQMQAVLGDWIRVWIGNFTEAAFPSRKAGNDA